MTAVRPSLQLEEAGRTTGGDQPASQPTCDHHNILHHHNLTTHSHRTMAQPPPRKDAYTRFIVNLHKVR